MLGKGISLCAGTIFALTSCATLNKKEINLSYLENTEGIVQNASLIYQDIFTYSKVGIEEFGAEESNLVANLFFKNNEWELGYISAVGTNLLSAYLSYKLGDILPYLNEKFKVRASKQT